MSAPFWWLIMRGGTGDGHAGGVLRVWVWWERWYLRRHDVRSLTPTSVFRIEVRRHRGATLTFADGSSVRRGDRIVELHLANGHVAAGSAASSWSPFQVLTAASSDLALIARLVASGRLGPVRAVHAVSLVSTTLARLGFTVTPLPPSLRVRVLRFYLVGLLAVYHPNGWLGAARARARAWPAEAWMSVASLENRGARD